MQIRQRADSGLCQGILGKAWSWTLPVTYIWKEKKPKKCKNVLLCDAYKPHYTWVAPVKLYNFTKKLWYIDNNNCNFNVGFCFIFYAYHSTFLNVYKWNWRLLFSSALIYPHPEQCRFVFGNVATLPSSSSLSASWGLAVLGCHCTLAWTPPRVDP
jgi:hypothetical protein